LKLEKTSTLPLSNNDVKRALKASNKESIILGIWSYDTKIIETQIWVDYDCKIGEISYYSRHKDYLQRNRKSAWEH